MDGGGGVKLGGFGFVLFVLFVSIVMARVGRFGRAVAPFGHIWGSRRGGGVALFWSDSDVAKDAPGKRRRLNDRGIGCGARMGKMSSSIEGAMMRERGHGGASRSEKA